MATNHVNPMHGDGADAHRKRSSAAQRVLETAGQLFYEHGIGATGVDAIAAHSGVTKMTLYKHFGAKDELVAAYLRCRDERWRDWFTTTVDATDGAPVERLLAVFDALNSWLRGEVEGFRGCAFLNAFTEITDPEHPARAAVLDQKQWMYSYLAELATEAGADDPTQMGKQLWVLFEGATVVTTMDDRESTIGAAREAAEVLVRARCSP